MLQRHDLLRVKPGGWPAALAASPGFQDLEYGPRRLVAGWAERGWPVIARRPAADDGEAGLAVGLPLPPAYGKLRLALSIPADLVAETVAAVPLSAAAGSAPAGWRPQVERLIALGERLALQPILFGALLWQRLTGLPYLRLGSDIDLIWPRPTATALPDLLETLDRLDTAGPVRLDGEIALSAGSGVNWRELRQEFRRPGGAVLVKSMDGADIRCVHTLFA
ncbi:MAG: malonate decarboxylase holo-[acyl-carrier-protein] synthase [Inquilinus sp.]|uniref:malonate decarboxylase holo-[acyl-carrier-protein] synthase n=1 Tax=Inquilinus sp. TaxID=1932117 RepID=UPI003F3D6847